MLGQFTWGQFLGCYGAMSLLWYLGLLFAAYRKEAFGFLGIGTDGDRRDGILKFKIQNDGIPGNNADLNLLQQEKSLEDQSGAAPGDQEVEDIGGGMKPGVHLGKDNEVKESVEKKLDDGLMGKVKSQLGLERIRTGSPVFAPVQKESYVEALEGTTEEPNYGLYEDMTAGIREIYMILAANDGNKQDFFGMVSELKAELGPLGSSPCIARVNTFIRDSAPFAVSQEELESLWD